MPGELTGLEVLALFRRRGGGTALPFLSRGARDRDRNEIAAAEQGGAEQELRHDFPPARTSLCHGDPPWEGGFDPLSPCHFQRKRDSYR
jgi:hypothetical protein